MMGICCCDLAGTAACQHCSNNPFATDVWHNDVNFPYTINKPVWNPKPITNADRIRAMSDEEMADFLGDHESHYLRYDMSWLEWLKQEAE